MKNRKIRWVLLLMIPICFLIWGCGEIAVGPRIRTNYVILHPGRPMQALENQKLKGRVLDGSDDAVEQDVGGWVFMPFSHWEAVKRKLEK